jgi:hypothetical protein
VSEQVHYRITKDDDPYGDGTPETHPWNVEIIRDGKWFGACCYETFDEALTDYVAGANARRIETEGRR